MKTKRMKFISFLLVFAHVFSSSVSPALAQQITVQDGSVNDWASFNVGAGENTSISVVDASGAAAADGRAIINVLQDYASRIDGHLDIHGIIAFINAHGFDIGADANINVVGGLVLSTLGISEADFFSGMAALNQAAADPGFISNQGNVHVDPGSFFALIAGAVKNTGTIAAEGGTAILAAGSSGTISVGGEGLVEVAVTEKVDAEVFDFQGNKVADQLSNAGTIRADGGFVKLTAKGAEQVFDNIVNHSGMISAKSVSVNEHGEVILHGGDEGIVNVSGTIDVSGKDEGEKGGTVHVLGDKVGLFGDARIDVSGHAGGGEVLIGGDYKGQNPEIQNASAAYMHRDASINASAVEHGDGGKIILWSDGSTRAYGTLLAEGGRYSGGGGFIETSGHYLDALPLRVSTAAPRGAAGTWLLDPYDIVISADGDNNVNGATPFEPSGASSNLNVTTLTNALASGDVTVQTNAVGGSDDGNITVNNNVAWNSGNALTLDALNNIILNAGLDSDFSGTVNLTAQNGSITDGGSHTGFIFAAATNLTANGDIDLQNSSNSIGNLTAVSSTGNMTLVDSGEINGISATLAVSGLDTSDGDGDISLTVQGGALSLNGAVNAGSGTVTITNSGTFTTGSGGDITAGAFTQNGAGDSSLAGDITTADGNIQFATGVSLAGNVALDTGADGAGDITILGTLNGAHALTLTAGTGNIAFNTGIGDATPLSGLTVNSAAAVSFNNASSNAAGNVDINAGNVNINRALNTTSGGTVTITNTGTLYVDAAGDMSLDGAFHQDGSGPVTLNGDITTTNDAITFDGAVTASGSVAFDAGSGNITASNASNDFSTVAITSGNDVTLTDAGELVLGASTVSGDLSLTVGGALTQSGTASVSGTTSITNTGPADAAVTLDQGSFTGAVSVNSANSAVTIVNDKALVLGNVTAGGNLSLTAAGNISQSANTGIANTGSTTTATVTTNGASIDLSRHSNNFGTVSVTATGIGVTTGAVTIDDTNGLTLGNFSNIEGAVSVTANETSNGTSSSNTGVLTVSGNLNAGSNSVTLFNNSSAIGSSTTAVSLSSGTLTSGSLLLSTNSGVINQAGGNIVSSGTTTLRNSLRTVSLNSATNNFTTVATTGNPLGNVTLQDTNGINFGASTVSGTLNVTAGGAITDSGNLSITGAATLAAGSGNNITLDSAGNNFGTVGITSGNNVMLVDSNAIDLGTSTVSGTLSVTTGGAITDSGTLEVTGAATLAAGSGNNITLDSAANNFSTVGITSGNNVTLVDTNALDLAASTVSGTLSVTSAGALTQSGALAVTGTTTLAAGSGNNITLTNASNNFSTVGITSGNNVSLTDSNALALGAGTVSGTLDVTTSGAITQSGALAVTGTATLAAGSANGITLNNASNDFSTVVVTSANGVNLRDTNAIDLGNITANGSLTLNAAGALTDSGTLSISGGTTITAGANDVTLDSAANNFGTQFRVLSGRNVSVVDTDAIVLGAGTLSGTLDVTAGGAITQLGPITVSGAAAFAAGSGNDITLTQTSNNFSSVGITSGNNVSLTDSNDLTLNASTTAGNFSADAAGAITVSGAVQSTGGGNIRLSSNGANTTNDLTINANVGSSGGNGSVTLTAGDTVTIADGATVGTAGSGAIRVSAGEDYSDSTFDNDGNSGGDIIMNGASALTTQDGNITVTARDGMDLRILNSDSDSDAGGGNIQITGGNSTTILNSAVTSGGTVTLTNGALALITASGDITSAGAFAQSGGGTFTTAGDITTSNADITMSHVNLNGDLTFSTGAGGGDISLQGAVSGSTNTLTLSAGTGNITANHASNDLGTIVVTSGNNVNLRDANSLALGASTVSGTLNVTASGAITQSGALAVTGTTTLAAGSSNDITLGNTSNNFSTVEITSANDVTLADANSIVLGAIEAGGDFDVTAGGDITIDGLEAGGTVDMTAGGNILKGAGLAADDITAGEDITLSAGGYIGTLASPLDVNTPGVLNLTAGGMLAGHSAVLIGIAASVLYGTPLGKVFFNLIQLNAPPPPPAETSSTGSTASTTASTEVANVISSQPSQDVVMVETSVMGGSNFPAGGNEGLIDTGSLDAQSGTGSSGSGDGLSEGQGGGEGSSGKPDKEAGRKGKGKTKKGRELAA